MKSNIVFEAIISPEVALYDASHLMPRVASTKRDPKGIDRLFFHHSGKLGRAGVEGAIASARFVIDHRDFPGPAYTFWIPAKPLLDDHERMVILRLNPDDERSWHTGDRARGVGAVFQGNTTIRPLTISHETCGSALIPWAVQRYSLEMPEALSWHAVAKRDGATKNKKTCPGKHAEAWLRAYLKPYFSAPALPIKL